MPERICTVDGCGRGGRIARGMCNLHYTRWRKHGDVTAVYRSGMWPGGRDLPEVERFWQRVDVGHPLGCWEWIGGVNQAGYGVFSCEPRTPLGRLTSIGAHRYAYRLLMGEVVTPHLDHLCRTPRCVNPDHLEPVSVRENTLRGIGPSARAARATHCVHGHEFTPENTWLDRKRNRRHCRECSRRRFREWDARRKSIANAVRAEVEMARTGP